MTDDERREKTRAQRAAYFQKNKASIYAKKKARDAANPEKKRAYFREYAQKNKAKIAGYAKKYYEANRDVYRRSHKKNYEKNRVHRLEMARKRHAANPEKRRAQGREYTRRYRERYGTKRFGMDKHGVRAMLLMQGGRCAICRGTTPSYKKDWHVDHDHETGVVRGILCAPCNLGIGHLRDDPQIAMDAATYLLKHKAKLRAV